MNSKAKPKQKPNAGGRKTRDLKPKKDVKGGLSLSAQRKETPPRPPG